jgi:hypothetical protein
MMMQEHPKSSRQQQLMRRPSSPSVRLAPNARAVLLLQGALLPKSKLQHDASSRSRTTVLVQLVGMRRQMALASSVRTMSSSSRTM